MMYASNDKHLPVEPASMSTSTSTSTSTSETPVSGGGSTSIYNTQNDLLLHKILRFYNENGHMEQMLSVINGETNISLRIIDWFATNYAKKHYTVYDIQNTVTPKRFKVYVDYKLKLRAYSKKRFDPFCRWDRINVPYKQGTYIQTTLGQLNFFKWAIENEVIRYIQENYSAIETDMNIRNNTSRKAAKSHHTSSATIDGCEIKMVTNVASIDKNAFDAGADADAGAGTGADADADTETDNGSDKKSKNRKKREELSVSATKGIKKEMVNIVLSFN
jgi:hypothetical protein